MDIRMVWGEVAFVGLGALIAGYSSWLLKHPTSRLRPRKLGQSQQDAFTHWGILNTDTSATQREAFDSAGVRDLLYSQLGVGLSTTIIALLLIGFFLMVGFPDANILTTPTNTDLAIGIAGLWSGFVAGIPIGHFLARRVPAPPGVLRPGWKPRRKLTDYISPIYTLIVFIICLGLAWVWLVVGSQTPGIDLIWLGHTTIHWSGKTLGAVRAGLIVFPGCIWLLSAWWAARMPSATVGDDPVRSQRFGDWLRARSVAMSYWTLWYTQSFSIIFTFGFIPEQEQTGILGFLHTAGGIAAFGVIWSIGLVGLFGQQSGCMGGRITGWFWQRPPVVTPEGA